MKILDRYAATEMVVPFLAGMLVIIIFLLGNVVFQYLDLLAARAAELGVFVRFVLLKLPGALVLGLPAGSLFGAALAVSRLSRDSEITMMRMAGVKVRRILLPMLAVGLLASAAAFLVQEYAAPSAERQAQKALRQLYAAGDIVPVRANVFFSSDNYFFYIGRIEHGRGGSILRSVMVYELPTTGKFPVLITADSATSIGRVWELRNGVMHKLGDDGLTQVEARFQSSRLDLRKTLGELLESQRTPSELTASELRRKIDVFRRSGVPVSDLLVSYYFRFSLPLSSLVLILCAAPLALRYGRTGSFVGLLIGLGVLFLFYELMVLDKALGVTGKLPPLPAAWATLPCSPWRGSI